MTYTLLINRDGNDIMQREITADDVVDILTGGLLTPIITNEEIRQEDEVEEEAEPVKKPKKQSKPVKSERSKGGYACRICHEVGA